MYGTESCRGKGVQRFDRVALVESPVSQPNNQHTYIYIKRLKPSTIDGPSTDLSYIPSGVSWAWVAHALSSTHYHADSREYNHYCCITWCCEIHKKGITFRPLLSTVYILWGQQRTYPDLSNQIPQTTRDIRLCLSVHWSATKHARISPE